jgi:hypothetical protein
MCELCNRKGMVFTVNVNQQPTKACSGCILANHLTGWSK